MVAGKGGINSNFLKSATTPGKGGVSPVGRALQKHASRNGSFLKVQQEMPLTIQK